MRNEGAGGDHERSDSEGGKSEGVHSLGELLWRCSLDSSTATGEEGVHLRGNASACRG